MYLTLQILFGVSIFLLLYSYVLYPLLLPVLAGLFGRHVKAEREYTPQVTVIVPVYNEEEVIQKKIDSILAMDYPPEKISVWAGSDQSTDRTNDLVRAYDDPRVHLWTAPRRGGKTGVLNGLAPTLSTDIIFMTDANTMHRPDCLRKLVRHYSDPEVGAVGGNVIHTTRRGEDIEETLYRNFESRQKTLESKLHSSISCFGGFYTIRRELFEPIPANSYSNDDVLIPMQVVRKGKRVIFEPEALSEEDMSEDVKMEFARRIRIGAGNFQAFFWLLDFLNPLRGWPAFCYVSHKVTRWFSPLFLLAGLLSSAALAVLPGNGVFIPLTLAGLGMILLGLTYKLGFRPIRPLYYFIIMNGALFLGFFRYLSGIKSAAWSRTGRQ